MDEIINILRNETDEYKENIKLINKKINDIRDIYFYLKPNGKELSRKNAANMSSNKDMFLRFVDTIAKSNYIAISHMISCRKQYEEYLEETNKLLMQQGINRDVLFSDYFSQICKSKMSKYSYDRFERLKLMDTKLQKMNEDIAFFCCQVIINMYESLLEEKETKKENLKLIEGVYKKARGKEELSYEDISVITELISLMELDDVKTSYLLNSLNTYIKSFPVKKKKTNEENKIKDNKVIGRYVDDVIRIKDDKQEVKYDSKKDKYKKFDNYIDVLLLIDTYDNLVSFLDSISYMDDFDDMISYALKFTENNELYEKLNLFLKKYISLGAKEEKESDNEDICVLYYGFNENKNRILDEISNIPEEYYSDIKKAIELIKLDGAYSKRTNAKKSEIKKVFKLRIDDIRVTFKRISKNVYIILGVFVKKDYHGNRIISTTKKRNYNLLEQEVSILNLFSDDSMKDEALNINSKMEDDILSTLSRRKIDKK